MLENMFDNMSINDIKLCNICNKRTIVNNNICINCHIGYNCMKCEFFVDYNSSYICNKCL